MTSSQKWSVTNQIKPQEKDEKGQEVLSAWWPVIGQLLRWAWPVADVHMLEPIGGQFCFCLLGSGGVS